MFDARDETGEPFLSLFRSLVEIVADRPSCCCRDRRKRYLVCLIALTLEYARKLADSERNFACTDSPVARKVSLTRVIKVHTSRTHPLIHSSCRSRSCRLLPSKGERPSILSSALIRFTHIRVSQTVLLDDPLSAVDSHTARHLYRKCLKGPLLANRTVVSVSPGSVSNSPRAERPSCHLTDPHHPSYLVVFARSRVLCQFIRRSNRETRSSRRYGSIRAPNEIDRRRRSSRKG